MRKFIKNNLKLIIGLIIGAILAGGIVYAATSAKDVTYTTAKNESIKNVEEALNDLYNNRNKKLTFLESKNNSETTEYQNYTVNNIQNYNYLVVVLTTSNRTGKPGDLMSPNLQIECDGVTLIGSNNAYIGSDFSSHMTKVFLIPVNSSSFTINKIIGWSFSIYGI